MSELEEFDVIKFSQSSENKKQEMLEDLEEKKDE